MLHAQLPLIWAMLADRVDVLDDLRQDIQSLALSALYRRRMTYVFPSMSLRIFHLRRVYT